MRVVDISSFFSDASGGIKTYYRHKADRLPALGVDCHVVVPGAVRSEEAFGGGVLHRLPGPPWMGDHHYRRFADASDVITLLRRLRPDVVELATHQRLPTWVDAAVGERAMTRGKDRCAVLGFLHGDLPRTFLGPLVRRLPRAMGAAVLRAGWHMLRAPHHHYGATLVASRQLRQDLRRMGVPRVRWVGLGVDTNAFSPGPARSYARSSLVVGYAGRLSADKRVGLLLGAWDRVAASTGARLVIAGAGPGRVRVRRFAAGRSDVEFLGHLGDSLAMSSFYRGVDVLVTPGENETFSFTTAEALACAVPVLAPAAGGAGELVRLSGAGARFVPGDPISLADELIALLLATPQQRAALGAAGRQHVLTHHTWAGVVGRLHATYRELLS